MTSIKYLLIKIYQRIFFYYERKYLYMTWTKIFFVSQINKYFDQCLIVNTITYFWSNTKRILYTVSVRLYNTTSFYSLTRKRLYTIK